jgi:hypothetical protein
MRLRIIHSKKQMDEPKSYSSGDSNDSEVGKGPFWFMSVLVPGLIKGVGRTDGKDGAQEETADQEGESDGELAVLANGGEEWLARCGLPDLVK